MLKTLKFVQGAVARRDFVPALNHFLIKGGRIKGFNGMIALCSPIELDLEVAPKATQFIKAVQTCQETIQLSMTPSSRLSIKSGRFKAFVDCDTGEKFPDIEPEGETVVLDGSFLKALKVLSPFIAEDASRAWARGILFNGPSAFATNNIVLMEYWLGYNFPRPINVPKEAVSEILRIGEEPKSLQVSEGSITFHYENNRWLRAQLLVTDWPDVHRVLDQEGATLVDVPDQLAQAVIDLEPFVDELGRIFFSEDKIATAQVDGLGAIIDVPGIVSNGIFNVVHLKSLEKVAIKADFTRYPKPCPFIGDRVRGIIVGIRP